MAATTFLVFYRFKSMNSDEAAKAKSEWNDLRSNLLAIANWTFVVTTWAPSIRN